MAVFSAADQGLAMTQANALRDQGVYVVVVGIGNSVNMQLLTPLAYNSNFVIEVPNPSSYTDTQQQLQNVLCSGIF